MPRQVQAFGGDRRRAMARLAHLPSGFVRLPGDCACISGGSGDKSPGPVMPSVCRRPRWGFWSGSTAAWQAITRGRRLSRAASLVERGRLVSGAQEGSPEAFVGRGLRFAGEGADRIDDMLIDGGRFGCLTANVIVLHF